MKKLTTLSVLLLTSFWNLYSMDSGDSSLTHSHESLIRSESFGSSDSDTDNEATTPQVITPRGRARSTGEPNLTQPTRPFIKQLSLERLSGDGYSHSAPGSKPGSPLARINSNVSCVSLPTRFLTVLKTASEISSRTNSSRTPRNADNAELYFAPDHCLKTILINFFKTIEGQDADAMLATKEFSDPDVIESFIALKNEKILCASILSETIKDRLVGAGVSVHMIQGILPYTLGVFGNDGICGSYIPSTNAASSNSVSHQFCVDGLTIHHSMCEVQKLFDQLQYIYNNSKNVQLTNSTTPAALAANPQSD